MIGQPLQLTKKYNNIPSGQLCLLISRAVSKHQWSIVWLVHGLLERGDNHTHYYALTLRTLHGRSEFRSSTFIYFYYKPELISNTICGCVGGFYAVKRCWSLLVKLAFSVFAKDTAIMVSKRLYPAIFSFHLFSTAKSSVIQMDSTSACCIQHVL